MLAMRSTPRHSSVWPVAIASKLAPTGPALMQNHCRSGLARDAVCPSPRQCLAGCYREHARSYRSGVNAEPL